MSIRKVTSKPMGELLLERGKITKDQLKKALDVQKEKGGLIGEILAELGFATEEDIAQALTAQYGFPFLPLENYEIDQEIIKLVPENLCKQYLLIPIDKIGDSLTLVMANPLNTKAIEDVELITKCNAQTFVSTASDIRKALKKYFKSG
jgi:hypothetical protein